MRPLDLIKATFCCGVLAYFSYRIPALSQALIIAILSMLWLSYLHSTVRRLKEH